jgi:hypothetical protein
MCYVVFPRRHRGWKSCEDFFLLTLSFLFTKPGPFSQGSHGVLGDADGGPNVLMLEGNAGARCMPQRRIPSSFCRCRVGPRSVAGDGLRSEVESHTETRCGHGRFVSRRIGGVQGGP